MRMQRYALATRLAVSLALGAMAAGCGSVGQGINDVAGSLAGLVTPDPSATGLAAARGARIALDPIEGAPADVTARLSANLAAEAAARQIAVVPAGSASYRLRGYLALRPERGATAVSWAWDVYDSGLHRAFRLGGQESGPVAAGNPWATADDALLRRIAQAGMTQLVNFIAAGQEPAAPEPEDAAPPLRGTSVAFDGTR
jgi:hypothetical protein